MADASRFPQLAVPFAIVGAAAGWLSAGLVCNPVVGFTVSRPISAGTATALAALSGLLIKRLCIGRRYTYELGEPDPDLRPSTDRWPLHGAIVLVAGAATGAVVGAAMDSRFGGMVGECALGGAACALVFVPVCLAVVAAARRAQRARLGSLVAESDRRAVWEILAITLAATTLEALPDWEASRFGYVPDPLPVVTALAAAAVTTLLVLRSDWRALVHARAAIAAGLTAHDADDAADDGAAARLDLGLGEDRLARVTRGAAAYRQKARAIALVRGSPDRALTALRRAVRRGALGLAVLAAIGAAHVAAQSSPARALYHERRCRFGYLSECAVASALVRDFDPRWSRALDRRARGER
jgi:hypothetical protein